MAKPCRYQLPGTDTWMSESEFKKTLNDGLIDQYVNDGVISIPNLKPKAATTPAAPVATETAVETPATAVSETKEDGKYFIDGKEVSEEEAIKEIQDESRGYGFNLSGKKIEYQGENEQAIRATKEHNESISPFNREGKLKESYKDAFIRKAFGSIPFRKFGNAYRKHVDPYFKRSNNESRDGGRVGGKNGMNWEELASYIIGDGRELATEEQFRAFAKELGLEVPTQETTKETPAEPVVETKEVKIPKNKRERQEAADKDEMVYHDLFGTALESTPEQYEAALKEIAETGNIKNIMKYGREISERQAPRRDSFRPSLLSYNKQDAQDTLDFEKKYKEQKQQTPATPVSETKVEPAQEAKPKTEPVAKEETPKYETKEAPKKMVAPGRTKSAFDRNFTVEISADGTTATVQGEPIQTADGRTLTPPKETANITTNINGERVAITSKGDTVYLDRAKEAEEKQVETEGKTPAQIREEHMALAKDSNGDYAIVYSRTNDPLVHKLNRKTGRWQQLNSKGEWVDANDNRNDQANDAVNYTRKDKKEVTFNGEKFFFDFKNNTWKKYSESDGSLSSISKDLAERIQKEFVRENPKRAAKKKAVEESKQETRDAIGENMTPEVESTLNSKEFEDGVEVATAPTAETDTKRKPKKGNRHMATQRRGAAIGFATGLIEQLEKVFPNLSRISGGLIVDQVAFDNIARILGASPYAAALLHDGVIYLNPSVANGNTAFEEYAHVYLMAIEQINPSLYNRGLALVEQATEYIDEVISDPEYAYIHGNEKYEDLTDSDKKKVQFEALSKMIADRAEKVFDERRKSPIVSWLKDLWQTIARVFKIGSLKLDLSRSTIDDYVKGIAKELNRNSPISMISKDQLADLMEGDLAGITVSKSVGAAQSPASHWLRTNFFANKGLQENEAYRLKQARRDIQVWQNRVKDTVSDLNQAVKDYVKATGKNKVDVLLDVNQSLSDPVQRANWFSSDQDANAIIAPVVESMRNQIDMLQAKLASSGLFNEDLTATITGNNDVYVNTSYYAFSGRNYNGQWMDLFSDAEKNQILDWVFNGSYQTASKVNYKVSPTGSIEVTFQNGFGIETESMKFDNVDSFRQFLADNAKLKLNGAPINIKKVKIGKGEGSFDFYAPMDISNAGIKFKANESAIYGHLNEIVKDRDSLSAFVHTQKSLTSAKAKSALKKKKNLDQTYKLFLREIKDPATNYANTIAKQSEILYKGMMEQGIIDSGYLASKKASGNNTVLISDPGSRLRGYYVSPELNRFLNDRTPNLLDIIGATPVNIFDRSKNKKMSTMGMAGDSLIGVATSASSFTKAYLTVLSIGSNAANYISGYFQLLKTGNMPFGMTSAMRALEQGFSSKDVFSKENVAASFLNTVPTIIRAMSNLANNTAMYNKGGIIGGLTEDQKKYFGVNDFTQLTPQQKAKVLLEELTSTGVIGTNIDVEMLKELTETAFDNTIPEEFISGKIQKILDKSKKFTGDTWDAITASYAFSDSMFKAIMYLQEKKKNLDTYGSVMAKQGVSPEIIEEKMREKTAIDVRKQMPTYDRSPDIIKALSKFPLIGTFIQFDFQSKVNDKNIVVDIFKMASDSVKMRKEGYSEEANKLMVRSATKLFSLGVTSTISMAVYNIVNAFVSGFDDDDDEAIRSLLPEYREYNMMLHLDENKKGLHTYLDVSRIDPQSLYVKYYRALTEDGFDAMADELLKPYYSQDIFVGGLAETLMNINQYGDYDKKIENMNFVEKLKYFVSERILPSGVVGQTTKLLDAIEGGEAAPGIDKSAFDEFTNMYFGMKRRTVDIGNEYAKKVKFDHFKNIQDKDKVEFNEAKKELEKIQDQFDRGKTTQANLDEAKFNLEKARIEANMMANEELKAARELTNNMRRLGYTDEEIRQLLIDNDATRYMINILLDPSQRIEFDSEGKANSGSSSGGTSPYGYGYGAGYGYGYGYGY